MLVQGRDGLVRDLAHERLRHRLEIVAAERRPRTKDASQDGEPTRGLSFELASRGCDARGVLPLGSHRRRPQRADRPDPRPPTKQPSAVARVGRPQPDGPRLQPLEPFRDRAQPAPRRPNLGPAGQPSRSGAARLRERGAIVRRAARRPGIFMELQHPPALGSRGRAQTTRGGPQPIPEARGRQLLLVTVARQKALGRGRHLGTTPSPPPCASYTERPIPRFVRQPQPAAGSGRPSAALPEAHNAR